MKTKVSVLYLMAVLIWLSFGSCKRDPSPAERHIDMTSSEDDSKKEETDSLPPATPDSEMNAEEMMKRNTILRKTKAQYVIY